MIIINQGKIVAEDSIDNLSKFLNKRKQLRLRINGPAEQVIARLSKIEALLEVTYQEPYFLLEFEKSKQPQAEVNQVLAQEGWTLFAMEEIEMSLEDIFVKLTRDSEEEL